MLRYLQYSSSSHPFCLAGFPSPTHPFTKCDSGALPAGCVGSSRRGRATVVQTQEAAGPAPSNRPAACTFFGWLVTERDAVVASFPRILSGLTGAGARVRAWNARVGRLRRVLELNDADLSQRKSLIFDTLIFGFRTTLTTCAKNTGSLRRPPLPCELLLQKKGWQCRRRFRSLCGQCVAAHTLCKASQTQ